MSLELLESKIQETRAQASVVQRNHSIRWREIKDDQTITSSYRAELYEELRRNTRAALVDLLKAENTLIRERIADIEKQLDAHTDTTSGGIIALRDAQDRADSLKPDEHERGLKLMQRALRSGDRTMAHALFRRAIDSGWREVGRAFIAEYPETGALANDLAALKTTLDSGFERTMHYAAPGV